MCSFFSFIPDSVFITLSYVVWVAARITVGNGCQPDKRTLSEPTGKWTTGSPWSVTVAAVLAVCCAVSAQVSVAGTGPEQYGALRYRYIGPEGSRVISVTGIPGDAKVFYAGAASGGIFKTADAGVHWEPIFDDQPVSSIGSLAVAPSDPNVIWAGTGETFIRSNISIGNGIYKSTDAGKTWKHMGLEETGRIGRVAIDPRDPNVVFAAAMGHCYGPQQERGVYRTKDGGQTWERVLFVDENSGASDIAMDPNNPRILYAGMWQIEIHTWGRTSGGDSSGLWMSRDGGDTWTELTGGFAPGLPRKPLGKIAVAVAASDSSRVYALIETGDGIPWEHGETDTGKLWRSDDGGATWKLASHDRRMAGRAAYYTRVVVNPEDSDEAYFVAGALIKTLDGGETSIDTTDTLGDERPLGDNHDMWIDPTDGDRMIVGNDGGLAISVNRARTWHRVHLPNAQMYHVAVDSRIPYYVYGNRQDGPSVRGPSNSLIFGGSRRGFRFNGIPKSMWHSVGGGESGWAVPDPIDPNIVWATASGSGSVGGIVERYDVQTRQYRRVEIWPESTLGWPAEDLKYRFNWTFPLLISPHDRNKVYAGSQFVHATTDGGHSWQVISSDLTTNDKSRQKISGGLTPDNLGVEYGCVVFAIDESPLEEGVIWAGSNDGLVHVTRDGGETWTNVTDNIPDLPPWGTVSNINASRRVGGKAYITVDFHQVNDRRPYVYKTTDYGRTWSKIVSGIPESPLSYAHCVREDPIRPDLLYLGTENALYVSFDDGASWRPLQNNLPHAPVHWLVVQEHFNDLVVGTYGRGFWILDDITPLQQLTRKERDADVHLFEPRPSYRFQPITRPMSTSYFAAYDATAGENPPYGASINYWLGSEPQGEVTLEILGGSGEVIRTLEGTRNVGINRVWWNLQSETTSEIRLRTSPLYAPKVELGPERWRPFGARMSVLMPPGGYTVRLRVDGRELARQVEVRKDPNTEGTEADIVAQTDLLFKIRDDLEAVAGMINRIEWTRRMLYDLVDVLKRDESTVEIRTAAAELDDKLVKVEKQLFQMKGNPIRWPTQLAGKLTYLAGSAAQGDFPPTTQAVAVHSQLRERTGTLESELETLLGDDLVAFNGMLRERGVDNIIADVR